MLQVLIYFIVESLCGYMSGSGEITPIGLIVAGAVFLGAAIFNSTVPEIGVVAFIGIVLLAIGILGFVLER